jgi:dienelactone hydrolase
MTRPRRALLVAVAVGGVAAAATAGLALVVGATVCAPRRAVLGAPPADLHATTVAVPTPAGSHLAGWWIDGRPGAGAVLLLHGVRADRRAMLGRARWLAGEGYSVLLVDLQSHGESPGTHITFGFLEGADALAAVRFIQGRAPGERIGVIGVSLGGAAALLAPEPLPVQALVAESVYSSIDRALENRLRIRVGGLAPAVAPLLLWQLTPRLGVDAAALRPVEAVRRLRCPILVLGGTRDRHTTPAETRALFDAAPQPKALWLVDGAAHVDLLRFAPEAYRQRVGGFLAKALR